MKGNFYQQLLVAISFAILSLVAITPVQSMQAQDVEKARIAIYDMDFTDMDYEASPLSLKSDTAVSKFNSQQMRSIPEYLISYYSNDDRFSVIDLVRQQLIKEELERQKSEEFIDGYIVAQGKQEGYDYIFFSKYNRSERVVSVRVYDVAAETVLCEVSEKIGKSLGLLRHLDEVSARLVQQLNISCFSLYYEVVRATDEKPGKGVKRLLILAGLNQKMGKGYEFDILRKVMEKVKDKKIERFEIVGKGEIEEVEDENFSILRVKSGGKEIQELLDENVDLLCKFTEK